MTIVRRIYRVLALSFWFLLNAAMAFPCLFMGWRGLAGASRQTKMWGSGIAKIINLNINVIGDLDRITGGGLIVSNHLGYLDIITHSALFPLRFTPKKEIAYWPVLGWILALNQPIWIDRGSRQASKRVMEKIQETLDHGIPLIVYPEGTSTDGKNGLLPFKSTPFEAVAQKNRPIFPILTMFRQESEDRACWHGDMPLLPHAWGMLGYPRLDVDVHVLEPIEPTSSNRKEIAAQVHDVMDGEFRRIKAAG